MIGTPPPKKLNALCVASRTDRYAANTRILVKDFGTQIVKLVLEHSLRSHDPVHMIHFPSGSGIMKAIELDQHNFSPGTLTLISTSIQCVCIIVVHYV